MSATTIPKPADRSEWLTIRRGFANASDAAVYVGASPFKSLADLAVEKLSNEPPVEISNRAIDRGNRLEPVVGEWWSEEHGIGIYAPQVMYLNGRLLATLDFGIAGAEREALEVKTTAHKVDGVTESWWWQGQAQAHCADLDRVHFAVLDGSMDLASYVVERDDDAIAHLVAEVERVWGYLDLGMTPEGASLTYDHVKTLYPVAEEKAVELTEEQAEVVARWRVLNEERLSVEKEEKAAKDEVARLFGDAAALTLGGSPVATFKNTKDTASLDLAALKADHPDLVAQYTTTKPGARRLISVKRAA